jgi:hypothetical protein
MSCTCDVACCCPVWRAACDGVASTLAAELRDGQLQHGTPSSSPRDSGWHATTTCLAVGEGATAAHAALIEHALARYQLLATEPSGNGNQLRGWPSRAAQMADDPDPAAQAGHGGACTLGEESCNRVRSHVTHADTQWCRYGLCNGSSVQNRQPVSHTGTRPSPPALAALLCPSAMVPRLRLRATAAAWQQATQHMGTSESRSSCSVNAPQCGPGVVEGCVLPPAAPVPQPAATPFLLQLSPCRAVVRAVVVESTALLELNAVNVPGLLDLTGEGKGIHCAPASMCVSVWGQRGGGGRNFDPVWHIVLGGWAPPPPPRVEASPLYSPPRALGTPTVCGLSSHIVARATPLLPLSSSSNIY